MRNILKCELADNCFGVSCCVNFGFTIPLSSIEIDVSFPMWFKMDPCDFQVYTGIGSLQFQEQLLKYDWGTLLLYIMLFSMTFYFVLTFFN